MLAHPTYRERGSLRIYFAMRAHPICSCPDARCRFCRALVARVSADLPPCHRAAVYAILHHLAPLVTSLH